MSDLNDLLTGEVVFARITSGRRDKVLEQLVTAAANAHGFDARRALDVVKAREALGGTGMGEGVAIPHGRVAGLGKVCGAFARLDPPVDFNGIDDRPCDLVFLLLAPEGAGGDHLKALARVARALRNPSLRNRLRGAKTQDNLRLCFADTDRSNAA
jgi:nitrogen PTS system EIIA component